MSFEPASHAVPIHVDKDDEFAIRVTGVSKLYQIYDRPADRLLQAFRNKLMRLSGRQAAKRHRDFWALNDVSFELRRGQTVGIIGGNGSGKSTLLQIICGTLYPTAGTVEVNGKVAALLELGSGFNPEFTGRENVYMNAAIYGLSHKDVDARYDSILEFAEIGDFIHQPVKTYSSGMLVRLAFAVIAHVDADILVVDEALSVGDAFFVQKCMRFLRRFMETGTVLFVSHDTGAVLNLCEYAIWLNKGVMKAKGTPKQIVDAYLEAIYLDSQGEGFSSAAKTEGSHNAGGIVELSKPVRDMRQDFINGTSLRNDLEVFEFRSDSEGFGKGGARIFAASLRDSEGRALQWVVGGETVSVHVHVEVISDLHAPIVGFQMQDRLGQVIIGDNTYLAFADRPIFCKAGQRLSATFTFTMPILPRGDYTLSFAVADGTQNSHVQHHWLRDAISVRAHSTSLGHGLIGIPMTAISLETQ